MWIFVKDFTLWIRVPYSLYNGDRKAILMKHGEWSPIFKLWRCYLPKDRALPGWLEDLGLEPSDIISAEDFGEYKLTLGATR